MKARYQRSRKETNMERTNSVDTPIERVRKARALNYGPSDVGMDKYLDWMVHCGKAYFLIGKVS